LCKKNWNLQQIISQIQGIIAVYGLKIVAGILQKIVRGASNKAKIDPTISSFIGNIAFIGILAFAALAALG
jgi:small-conductance mechanosensitive channel